MLVAKYDTSIYIAFEIEMFVYMIQNHNSFKDLFMYNLSFRNVLF